MTTKIDAAIRESIHTNSRVAVTLTEADFDDFICEADGSARENDGTLDVWGSTDDGHEWRLCVTVEQSLRPAQLYALRLEACAAGDWAQVDLCNLAVAGDVDAMCKCVAAVEAAAFERDQIRHEILRHEMGSDY